MDLVKVSLEALLQRATNPQNQNIDTAAVEAFCALMNKERDGPPIGVKLLAARIHSKHEQEVLQALHILDCSMLKCGTAFQSEVGKFRFLNEMIKLVSPKYLGCYTPVSVKQKVLQLMYLWTLDYPKETKIREAYDMLKKQGVIKEVPLSISAEKYTVPEHKVNTIFQDDEKSKLLKKLLKSKNPEDLQAANRLIKTMVKEDEKKAELKSKRISELESVQNNVRLLNEMLDSYKPGLSSQDEHDLIKELRESCDRLRPNIVKLASETQQNEEILGEILRVNDEMGQVFDKFSKVILKRSDDTAEQKSLLDLSGNAGVSALECPSPSTYKFESNVDSLCDILTPPIASLSSNESDDTILKPTTINHADLLLDGDGDFAKSSNKLKALEDLDAMGEYLLQQNLQSTIRTGQQFHKLPEKVPMNALSKQIVTETEDHKKTVPLPSDSAFNFDLTTLLDKPKTVSPPGETKTDPNGDDLLVDISEDIDLVENEPCTEKTDYSNEKKVEIKLSDFFVDLKNVKPSSVKPVVALEEKSDVTVTLHFAKDKPHEDVIVIVVTIISRNELPVKNVLFRAIPPKACKVKLQPPSATDLPPFNPFLPPTAITQVMLIANPEKVRVSLKFIVSYNVEDETLTEMGEIESLPAIP